MKLSVILILTSISVLLCSWTKDTGNDLAVSYWNVSIGEDALLSSWKKNKMGDTAVFDKTKYLPTDTLFAANYLCGQYGRPVTTTLTIKNQQDEIIKETINPDHEWGFDGYVKLSEIINLEDFKSGKVVSIFLTVDMQKDDHVSQPVLLGRLKIK